MNKRIAVVLQLGFVLVAATMPLLAGVPVNPAPEPASVLLIGGGLGAIILYARKKRSAK